MVYPAVLAHRTSEYEQQQAWRDVSVGGGTCHQTWQPESNPKDPHGFDWKDSQVLQVVLWPKHTATKIVKSKPPTISMAIHHYSSWQFLTLTGLRKVLWAVPGSCNVGHVKFSPSVPHLLILALMWLFSWTSTEGCFLESQNVASSKGLGFP